MADITGRQGDSIDYYHVKIDGVTDYTNYTGAVSVLDYSTGEQAVAPMAITPEVDGFYVGLTPDVTTLLAPKTYRLVFEMMETVGGSVVYRKEMDWSYLVTKSYIN